MLIGAILGAFVDWITKDDTWFVIFMMFGLAIGVGYENRANQNKDS